MVRTNNLQKNLFKNCIAGKTGTVIMTTNDNKSCQIILTKGTITALSFGRSKGLEGLIKLSQSEIMRSSFMENALFPTNDIAKITDSDYALKILGYMEGDTFSSEEEHIKLSSNHPSIKIEGKRNNVSVKTYRGQEIEEASATPNTSNNKIKNIENEAPSLPQNKPVRMYRGQIIED